MKNYRHIFFDMDNTVTRSKSLITPEMREALTNLMKSGRDVIIVSGQTFEQISKQTAGLKCYYLAQNGNHAIDKSGTELWRRELSDIEKEEILKHIHSIPRTWKVTDEDDLIEDRGSQISYSLLGHHENIDKKEKFDPDSSKRRKMLEEHPLKSSTVEVKIGGTTTFDYVRSGMHKGFNVLELIKNGGWKKEESVYVGDALFPGGNDEAVMGVIDAHAVENPAGTLLYVQKLLSSKPS